MVPLASRLIVAEITSQEQVERYLLPKPNGEYNDADVRAIIRYYFTGAVPLGVDPLLAIAQMCHETGFLSSYWAARPRCNPAGIGVTGEPGAGVSFGLWSNSVPAHLGRLVAYAVAPALRTPAQEAAVVKALTWRPLPVERQGVAPTLDLLAGSWAEDPDYAGKLVRVAEAILAT
jgi:hypothetical protein